jgi:hypothetical protein
MSKDEALRMCIEAIQGIASAMPFPVGRAALAAAREALAEQPAAPPGCVVVPVEPTEQMLHSARLAWLPNAEIDRALTVAYTAMIAAMKETK